MLRTMSRFSALSAVALVAQLACSAAAPTGDNGSIAGAPAAGMTSSVAGAATGGASATGGAGAGVSGGGATAAGDNAGGGSGMGTSGAGAGGTSTGGMSAGGSSGGGSAGMSAGGAGGSSGGSAGSAGSSGMTGVGGTVNQYGTIVGSPAAATLVAMTKNCTAANKIASDTGKFQTDAGATIHVCALKGGTGNTGGAVYYTADMDIDCDGLMTTHCPGTGADKDGSYYGQTSYFGPNSKTGKYGKTLAAENTPYVVIPEEVVFPGLDQQNGGNIVAVIYKGQIEFGVFGDTIAYQAGDKGEPTGEASVRAAVGLGIPASPANGGAEGGVTYIAFAGPGSQPKDMEDLAEVQALGMKLLTALLTNNK